MIPSNKQGGGNVKLFIKFDLVILLALVLFGCNSQEVDRPGITGYVMDKQENEILVVAKEAQDFRSTGGIPEFYNAVWFSNAPSEIAIGDYVNVWYDFVAESYPGQSEVKEITAIPSEPPNGAILNESEILAQTLQSLELTGLYGVELIEFHANSNVWRIILKDLLFEDEESIELEVPDQIIVEKKS